MSWVTVGITGATALMAMQKAERQADQQKKNNLAQAEITRYSPWTGMRGQIDNSYAPTGLEGAVGGGVQGLGIAQGLGVGGSSQKMNAQQQANYDALGQQSQQTPWWTLPNVNGLGKRNA